MPAIFVFESHSQDNFKAQSFGNILFLIEGANPKVILSFSPINSFSLQHAHREQIHLELHHTPFTTCAVHTQIALRTYFYSNPRCLFKRQSFCPARTQLSALYRQRMTFPLSHKHKITTTSVPHSNGAQRFSHCHRRCT